MNKRYSLRLYHTFCELFINKLGQVGFEPTANRLKAEYSTTELLTQIFNLWL
jgi:hypothetical protein